MAQRNRETVHIKDNIDCDTPKKLDNFWKIHTNWGYIKKPTAN